MFIYLQGLESVSERVGSYSFITNKKHVLNKSTNKCSNIDIFMT